MLLTDQQKIDMINIYESTNRNLKSIAKEFNVSDSNVGQIFKRRGVVVKHKGLNKYLVNAEVFNIIDTEEKAYWLGFIFGDGSVRKNALRIELSRIDKNHLEKFIKFIETNSIVKNSSKNCCYIYISSYKLLEYLSKYGIIPNKTYLTKTLPILDKSLFKHFIRGLLDADGWISEHKLKRTKSQFEFGFSSYHIEILNTIQNWINQEIQGDGGYIIERKRKNQKVCQLVFGGRKNFIKIYDLIYKNASVYLDRKHEKILGFINRITNNLA